MLVGGFTKSYCVWPREEPCGALSRYVEGGWTTHHHFVLDKETLYLASEEIAVVVGEDECAEDLLRHLIHLEYGATTRSLRQDLENMRVHLAVFKDTMNYRYPPEDEDVPHEEAPPVPHDYHIFQRVELGLFLMAVALLLGVWLFKWIQTHNSGFLGLPGGDCHPCTLANEAVNIEKLLRNRSV